VRENVAWIFRGGDRIPTSHRDPFLYLEACRVQVDDGRVVYWPSRRGTEKQYAFNIPALNTAVLLLGPGCSISSDAVELLCAANVVVGFTGSGSTPLQGGIDSGEPHFLSGASEYRPTQYMQRWVSLWMDEKRRLAAAQSLLIRRNTELESIWKTRAMQPYLESVSPQNILASLFRFGGSASSASPRGLRGGALRTNGEHLFAQKVRESQDEATLLGLEGARVKKLYQQFQVAHGIAFERDTSERRGVNGKLTMGNYIAYGLAASALYTLGISFAFPLLHGKTRRGGLVFDVADILKDAVVVPMAFALRDEDDAEFRRAVKTVLMDIEGLRRLIEIVVELSECS